MLRIEREIDSAHIVRVLRVDQNLLPMGSAVERTINATLWIRFVDMAECGYINPVRIGWIDDDFSDLACLSKTDRNARSCLRRLI